jgi:hypothetical protein
LAFSFCCANCISPFKSREVIDAFVHTIKSTLNVDFSYLQMIVIQNSLDG